MKPKLTKPETAAAILTRLIGASLAGSTPTQSAEVRWGGWRVIAQKERSGATSVLAWPPRGKRREASSGRGIPRCVRELLDGAT